MRLQLHILERGREGAPGFMRTMGNICAAEGVAALWKGTSAALLRSVTYGGLRFGLYNPIKAVLSTSSISSRSTISEPSAVDVGVPVKLFAALMSGAFASLATNPAELIKVRLQANTDIHINAPPTSSSSSSLSVFSSSSSSSGAPIISQTSKSVVQPHAAHSQQPSIVSIFRSVVKARGIKGLWAGSLPSISRGAMLTASQCVTYDETKRLIAPFLHQFGDRSDGETFSLHFIASIISGLVSTTATNPIDVVKTYMFVNRSTKVADCVRSILQREGPRAFFKGWLASYVRLGPQTTLIFLFSERLRQLVGMEHM